MEQISNKNDIKFMNSKTHHCKSLYLLIKDKFLLLRVDDDSIHYENTI